MKNWTCCILSAILIVTSSVFNINIETENNYFNMVINAFTRTFMGLDAKGAELTEIVINLEEMNISDEMQIEIEGIKAEISVEEAQKENQSNTSSSSNTDSDNDMEMQDGKKPTVLIYHTHTDEAYLKGEQDYVETSTGRTLNQEYSVVAIGNSFKKALENNGFKVVHDKTDNVSASFSKAYQTSYETIKQYIGKVDVYVDMHRDAYLGQTPNTVVHNNTEYARVCFVVANGENYSQKPNWKENYKLAEKLTQKLNELCPNIAKDIIFKNARYNQHVSNSSLLIEMGNEQNTLEQVKASAQIVAQAFNEVF